MITSRIGLAIFGNEDDVVVLDLFVGLREGADGLRLAIGEDEKVELVDLLFR